MEMQIVSYKGMAGCIRLADSTFEMIISTAVGPRILVYCRLDGVNMMKNFDSEMADIRPDVWQSYGGHRLWHAPEVAPRTYFPDNDPVEYRWDGKVLTLNCVAENTTGLQKEILIEPLGGEAGVRLCHRIYNRNSWAVSFAPWCLSVMAPGGRAVIPQEPFVPHGSGLGESFAFGRTLILWQFTKMNDPRFTWGEKFIQMRQDDQYYSKLKIGGTIKPAWAAYALGKELFVKNFEYKPDAVYTDGGCNAEFFTMPGFLEIESLGAYGAVEPGAYAETNETWHIYPVELAEDDDLIEKQLNELKI